MTSTLPAPVAATNVAVLTEALAAADLSPKKEDGELEEGEIAEGDAENKEDDGKVKTVFDDAANFNVKHPLYSEWTLHFDSPASKNLPKTPSTTTPTTPVSHGGWMDDIRKVVSVDTVEEFWGLYNNIVLPSQLPGKANYYLFKDGIMPAWEDPANKAGGKWSIQLPRDKTRGAIDKMWLYTMLAAIGETFETPLSGDDAKPATPLKSDLVTGVICSSRPAFYRIAIWTRLAPETSAPETDELMQRTMAIGRHFKTSVLGFDINAKFGGGLSTDVTFESHKNSEKKGNKDKIVV